MGEHSPIPVPEEARSLIERVSSGLSFGAPHARVSPQQPPVAAPATRDIGARHPVDRERLRENGFIVPGDPVSALLEELRLVKRPLLLAAAESRAGRGAATPAGSSAGAGSRRGGAANAKPLETRSISERASGSGIGVCSPITPPCCGGRARPQGAPRTPRGARRCPRRTI